LTDSKRKVSIGQYFRFILILLLSFDAITFILSPQLSISSIYSADEIFSPPYRFFRGFAHRYQLSGLSAGVRVHTVSFFQYQEPHDIAISNQLEMIISQTSQISKFALSPHPLSRYFLFTVAEKFR
jgi:hypothetical protein